MTAVLGGVDPRLIQLMQNAGQGLPYKVRIDSGFRKGDKRQHGHGTAIDVKLIDQNGKELNNYQDPTTFRAYESIAQNAKRLQHEQYPELDSKFRWGGYFSGKPGKYGALDTMHFDLGGRPGLGMLGGSWEGGLTPQQAKIWGITNSQGMNQSHPQMTTTSVPSQPLIVPSQPSLEAQPKQEVPMTSLQDYYKQPQIPQLPEGLLNYKPTPEPMYSPMQMGLIQAGLAMMNNQSSNFGQGVAQGLSGYMNGNASAENQARELQQLDQSRQLQQFKLQQAQSGIEQEAKDRALKDAQREAIMGTDWSSIPKDQIASQMLKLGLTEEGLSALKQQNGVDPYWTNVSTANGVYAVNSRDPSQIKQLTNANGQPIIKSSDDVNLQGNIAGAKEFGKNPAIAQRDMTKANIDTQQAVNEVIQTTAPKVQQQSLMTSATEAAKGQAGINTTNLKNADNANQGLTVTKQAEELLKKNPTSSTIGSYVDNALGFFGQSTSGAETAAQLKVLGGKLQMTVPRFEGPQSDGDRAAYNEMAGSVGNDKLPVEQRLASLKAVQDILRRQASYTSTQTQQAPVQQAPTANPISDLRAKYGVK